MIFYFTGTGNSLAAAQTIARATDDLLVDIGAAYKYKDFDFTLAQGEQLGFVFPGLQLHHAAHHRCVPQASPLPHGQQGNLHARLLLRRDQLWRVRGQHGARLRQAPVGRAGHQPRRLVQREIGGQLHIPVRARPRREAQAPACRRGTCRARDGKSHRSPRARTRRAPQSPRHRAVQVHRKRDEKPRSTSEFFALPTCISCGQCADLCPYQHHHDHRRRAPLGRAGLHAVPRLPAPLPL